ncbi:hypothetical protein MHSWG343_03700 [Candidatus Mycoplasma haematohominis]|uniref:Uncharacterized protein n=1 Tax=Candidatus Mycoplasma haematohominis TaxID=1494318 RepID=A0A478FQX9_9MOLU|nr:hypothetical protein MHSWG343_03700 [Candidatus Mycoplasma haemohominis]
MNNQKYIPCWKKKKLILIANPEKIKEFAELSKKLNKKIQTIDDWSYLNPPLQDLIKRQEYTVRNIKNLLEEEFYFPPIHAKKIAEFIWIRDKLRKSNIDVAMIPKYTDLYQDYKDFFVQIKNKDFLKTNDQIHEFLIQAPRERIQYLTRNIAGVVLIGENEDYPKNWRIADSVTRKSSLPLLVFKSVNEDVIRNIDNSVELKSSISIWRLIADKLSIFYRNFPNKVFSRLGWSC